ncbi:TPA: hypothetical protein ACWWDF_003332 [Enterococcus faecium]
MKFFNFLGIYTCFKKSKIFSPYYFVQSESLAVAQLIRIERYFRDQQGMLFCPFCLAAEKLNLEKDIEVEQEK